MTALNVLVIATFKPIVNDLKKNNVLRNTLITTVVLNDSFSFTRETDHDDRHWNYHRSTISKPTCDAKRAITQSEKKR